MSHDIWRIHNTSDVLVVDRFLPEGWPRAVTLAHGELVTTITTQLLGGDGLNRDGDVGRWFSSLWAGHHRPTISHNITEGSQGIFVAELNVGNSVVRGGGFHNRSQLVVRKGPDLILVIVVPALVYWTIGSVIEPVLLSTLVAPRVTQVGVERRAW